MAIKCRTDTDRKKNYIRYITESASPTRKEKTIQLSPKNIVNDLYVTGLQINLYLEQPMEIQLFATFFQRRK
jgi:hypothetical protein